MDEEELDTRFVVTLFSSAGDVGSIHNFSHNQAPPIIVLDSDEMRHGNSDKKRVEGQKALPHRYCLWRDVVLLNVMGWKRLVSDWSTAIEILNFHNSSRTFEGSYGVQGDSRERMTAKTSEGMQRARKLTAVPPCLHSMDPSHALRLPSRCSVCCS